MTTVLLTLTALAFVTSVFFIFKASNGNASRKVRTKYHIVAVVCILVGMAAIIWSTQSG